MPTRDVHRRLLVDVAVLALAALAFTVRQPWLSSDLARIASFNPGGAGLLALGVVPFLLSFLAVEGVAFAVPPWRRLIRGGPDERELLWRIAVGVGLGVAGLLALAMAATFEKMAPVPPSFRWWVVSGFVAVTAGIAIAGRIVDRGGLGGGFALFLLVGAALAVFNWIVALARIDVLWVLLPGAMLAVGVGGLVLWTTRPPYPAWGGLIPAAMASGAANVGAGYGLGAGVLGALVVWVVSSAAFARGLHPPERIAQLGAPDPVVYLARRDLLRARYLPAVGATMVLCLGGVVPALLPGILRYVAPFLLSTAFLVALAADRWEEAQLRWASDTRWTAAWPLHQLWQVQPALAALASAGIPGHVRSVRYRALTGPFASLVPMDVLVPEDRVAAARAALAPALRISVSAVVRDKEPSDGGAPRA